MSSNAYNVIVMVMGIVQLEVIEQVMGYSEYDLTTNKHVDTVTLNYPPSVIKTVGLVSSAMPLQLKVVETLSI